MYAIRSYYDWPDKLNAGSRFDTPVSTLDLYPTFANIAKATIPSDKILDGKDILSDLTGEKNTLKDRPIFALRFREGYSDVGIRQNVITSYSIHYTKLYEATQGAYVPAGVRPLPLLCPHREGSGGPLRNRREKRLLLHGVA